MLLLGLVAGIILLATSGWFPDQHTVGAILTAVFGTLLVFKVVLTSIAASKINATRRNINKRRW